MPGPTSTPTNILIIGSHDIIVEFAIDPNEPTKNKYGKEIMVAGSAKEKKDDISNAA